MPAPEPTFAVTTQFVPLPVTEVMVDPVSPVSTRLKAAAVTLVTARLKVTFHDTVEVAAVCVQAVAQVMAVTVDCGAMNTTWGFCVTLMLLVVLRAV